jgi:lysophospholipase L1-like esterase
MKILALGDCNTFGNVDYENNSFPERFAKKMNAHIKNCGYTMSTTREMKYFAEENIDEADIVLIQYGLVDSWKTFKYAPYILYYPDNKLRKLYRKIVKKYKKIAKKLTLNSLLGTENVVPEQEYKDNIEQLILKYPNKKFILIDTIPNKELSRNHEIIKYNFILEQLSILYSNCYYVKIYDLFLEKFDEYYLDNTHINNKGYDVIALELFKKIKTIYKNLNI